jgi:hypothetical protein
MTLDESEDGMRLRVIERAQVQGNGCCAGSAWPRGEPG